MKKTVVVLLLSVVAIVLSVFCFAADTEDVYTADALNELGLLLGTGNGYELDKGLTRADGVTLLVRMVGMEETAQNGVFQNPFTDVPVWAVGYVGCAFEHNITNGTGKTTFSPNMAMTDYMFLTMVLRALDYSDKGEAPLFVWNNPYALAVKLGLIESAEPDTNFTRADAIRIFWNALDVRLNASRITLAQRLIEQGVFTAAELAEAREIQENGRSENAGVPTTPPPKTTVPTTPPPRTTVPTTPPPKTTVTTTPPTETTVPGIGNENETPDW